MNLDHVFAKTTTVVGDGGHPTRIQAGSHWLADDAVVRAHPDLFTEDCRYGLAFSGEPPGCLAIPPGVEDPVMTEKVRARSRAEQARPR